MKIRVGILSGGISRERYLSLRSGLHVLSALKRNDGIEPYLIDWEGRGRWTLHDGEKRQLASASDLFGILRAKELDCLFDAFSGTEEIDGHIAALIDLIGIPCVGNGFYASFTGMDKQITKLFCADLGLPVIPGAMLRLGDEAAWDALVGSVGFPLILKPNDSGSSCGVSLVKSPDALRRILSQTPELDFPLLAEKYVKGREFCAAVYFSPRDRGLRCAPIVEVLYPGEIFDAECKEAGTYRTVPAEISDEARSRMNGMARRLHAAIRADFFTRTDFIVDADDIRILEINTHPGLGECSILPAQLAASGFRFEEYLDDLITYVMERKPKPA